MLWDLTEEQSLSGKNCKGIWNYKTETIVNKDMVLVQRKKESLLLCFAIIKAEVSSLKV